MLRMKHYLRHHGEQGMTETLIHLENRVDILHYVYTSTYPDFMRTLSNQDQY